LIEKAGGKTITNGKIPLTEYIIKTYHDKLAFGVGSA
jgi:fructose-1,6-bisphosphatase